jgi:hypothetical protein
VHLTDTVRVDAPLVVRVLVVAGLAPWLAEAEAGRIELRAGEAG